MCDRHPPFSLNAGDRATDKAKGLGAAIDRAARVAARRSERQRVTIHRGSLMSGFIIQARERYDAWSAEQEASA